MVQILKESVRRQISEAAESTFAGVGYKKATIGMIAGGFLLYGVIVRQFRLFPEPEAAH